MVRLYTKEASKELNSIFDKIVASSESAEAGEAGEAGEVTENFVSGAEDKLDDIFQD